MAKTNAKNALHTITLLLFWYKALAQSHPQQFAFDKDLESWPRLKRRAGYFTNSYVYQGGLYELARSHASEFYTCSEHNSQYCTTWTFRASRVEKVESGYCSCQESHSSYCSSWTCFQRPLGTAQRCGNHVCRDENQNRHSSCLCDIESKNARYCEQWSCTEINADGIVEDTLSSCLREDQTGQYCARWKENSVSKREIESTVCECDSTRSHYCYRWVCEERSIIKCSAYNSRWCNFELGVGLGGGLGAFFILVSVFLAWKWAPVHRRFESFIVAFAVLCLPWTIGVALWGGVRALAYVGGGWGICFIVSCFFLCRSRRYQDANFP